MLESKDPARGLTNRILGLGFRWIEIWLRLGVKFEVILGLGFDFSESSERRGRSSWSWLEEEEERERREEMERDSASDEFMRSGAFSQLVEDDTVLR